MSYINGNLPTQGSHFSDGVRVGKVVSGSGNVQVSSDLPVNQTAIYAGYRTTTPYGYTKGANGTLISPRFMYVAQPVAQTTTSVVSAFVATAPNTYLTLVPTTNITTRAIVNGQSVIVFDYAQTVQATRIGTGTAVVSVWGYDYGNVPMYEEINFTGSATNIGGNKAFKSISFVYVSTADTWSIGGNQEYGLPFYVPDFGFISGSTWSGVALVGADFIPPIPLTATSTATTLDVRGLISLEGLADPNGTMYLCVNMYVQGATDNVFTPPAAFVPQTPQGMIGVPQFTRSLK